MTALVPQPWHALNEKYNNEYNFLQNTVVFFYPELFE